MAGVQALRSKAEEVVEVLGCYFPVVYTPPPSAPGEVVTRAALASAVERALGCRAGPGAPRHFAAARKAGLLPQVGLAHCLMQTGMPSQHQAHSHPGLSSRNQHSAGAEVLKGKPGAGKPGRMPCPCWQHVPARMVLRSSKSTCHNSGLVCGLCWLQQPMAMKKEQRYCLPSVYDALEDWQQELVCY